MTKFLGVIIDDKLSFSRHTSKIKFQKEWKLLLKLESI